MDPVLLIALILYATNVISVGTLFLIYNCACFIWQEHSGQDSHTASVGTQTSPDYYSARFRSSEDSGDAMPNVSHDLKAPSFSITQTYDDSPTGNKEYAEKSKVGQSAIKSDGRKLVELVFYCKACGASDHLCSPAAGLFCPNLKTY